MFVTVFFINNLVYLNIFFVVELIQSFDIYFIFFPK